MRHAGDRMTDVDGAGLRGASPVPVVLGPVVTGAHRVVVRPGRFDDHPRWRELRLRDRALIEPFWSRSALTWDERHRRNEWVREVLDSRRHIASGRALPCVIDVDGALAGQVALTAIDTVTATAELGIWIDSRLGRSGVATVATGMLVDHAFSTLGIRRVVAPAATDNAPAARASARAGFHRAATLPGWAPTGGHDVVAHDLWVLDRDDLGPGGLTTVGLRMTDPTADAVDVEALTRPARGHATVPHRFDDAVAVARHGLGRARTRVRRMGPPPMPADLDVAGTGLRLRRRRVLTAPMVSARSATLDDLCGPIRSGAWFDTDDADVVYEVRDTHTTVGRIALVGVNRSQGFAELAVSVDRSAASASDRAIGQAIRDVLGHAMSAMSLRRISTAVLRSDVRAGRLADAAGLHHETSLDGADCGRAAGTVEVWGLSATGDATV
ncbi:ribosomal-protein-alanine N-acetyltransferase [Williamsia serinedens]|uniref:Ribosomal-protein-alanine N-acetyltransferase n=2 Tax=Williamsia serinedens TaxID=391736 RepID=A0ABT1H2Z3_9NOCA|nr:ribosomal-protein-alanine N-acetyltransferase [Williamsia serinedens]